MNYEREIIVLNALFKTQIKTIAKLAKINDKELSRTWIEELKKARQNETSRMILTDKDNEVEKEMAKEEREKKLKRVQEQKAKQEEIQEDKKEEPISQFAKVISNAQKVATFEIEKYKKQGFVEIRDYPDGVDILENEVGYNIKRQERIIQKFREKPRGRKVE